MHLRSADGLRALAKQEGLSYRDIAAKADCSFGFIGHLVAGRRNCTPELAQCIAEVLGADVRLLFAPDPSSDGGQNALRNSTAA
jgi:transcriptional regulator with XRE-family HTH domain